MHTPAPGNIGIIILAAGQSRRFQGDKRMATMANGKMLLEVSLENVPPGLNKRILVLHPGDEDLATRFRPDWEVVVATQSTGGMGASLAAGIRAIQDREDWAGVLIGLGDMPFIRPDTYTRMQQSLCRHPLLIPTYQGRRGHPVGFQQAYFAALAGLQGDRGARDILHRFRDHCVTLECEDSGIIRDIDTREALTMEEKGELRGSE